MASQIQNSNFVSDIDVFESIGAGTQTGGPQVSSGHTRWTLASYLGRVNYTLANRYLFTVTGRDDGSSRFGADHQWGFFPSAALGWRVTDEPFMAKYPGDRAAQVSRVVRARRQSVDPAVPVDGAPAVAAVHVRRHGRAGLLPGVGRQSEPRLGDDAPTRLRRGPRPVRRTREPDGRHLSKEDRPTCCSR